VIVKTLFQFDKHAGKGDSETDLWIGYCAFHLGDYKRAYDVRKPPFFATQRRNAFLFNAGCKEQVFSPKP